MKIKILHLIKSLGRGGAEMLLPETLKLHDQTKFEFHYIYFLSWKDQMVEAIRQRGGVVTCLAASNNLKIILKYRAIIQYIKQHDIELIHCHLPWAGIVGRIVQRLTGIQVIYTEHNKQERYHMATKLMNRFTFNWQNGVVAVSKDVASSIRKNIGVDVPVHEILNGVNTDYYKRDVEAGKIIKQKSGISDSAFVIGTIAVFRFQKRLKEWLDIFAAVSANHPNAIGIIVGDGPLKPEIEEHVNRLGLQEKIMMPGLQTDVKPWLSAMDVFMMSSIFEGLPIALLEAMSMECAIVTTDAGGIKEVIEHNKNGLMVKVEDWKTLEAELDRFVTNPDLLKSLSSSARASAIESFGMKRMVKELEALYSGYQLPVAGNRKPVTGKLI